MSKAVKEKKQQQIEPKSSPVAATQELPKTQEAGNEEKKITDQLITKDQMISIIQQAKNGVDHPEKKEVLCQVCKTACRKPYSVKLPKRYYKCPKCKWTFFSLAKPKSTTIAE